MSLYSKAGQSHRDEEIASDRQYCGSYRSNRSESTEVIVADFEDQAKKLDRLFGCGQGFSHDWLVQAHTTAPAWVEKFFAQVPWYKVATNYSQAVELALGVLKKSKNGSLYNFLNGRLDMEYLHNEAKSLDTRRKLEAAQATFNLVVQPAQFGIRHRGRSCHRASELLEPGEYNLDTFSVLVMLISHTGRLEHKDDLWINCAGDTQNSPSSEAPFDCAPCFNFDGTDICLISNPRSRAMSHCGQATGFFPGLD